MSAGSRIRPSSKKALQLLLAQALDVEGAAGDEVLEMLDALERAGELAGAAAHHGFGARRRWSPAPGAWPGGTGRSVGKDEGLGAGRPLLQHHRDDLRDHVAGALDDDGVADAQVLAGDLVGIVQGGVLHHHAADGDRGEPGHGRHRAGAADLDVDGLQDGAGLLGGELAGHRPARRARDEAQAILPVQAIDLVDHAVDIEGQMRPLALHRGIGGQQALDALHPAGPAAWSGTPRRLKSGQRLATGSRRRAR